MSSMLRTTRLLTRLAIGGLVMGTAALVPEIAWAQAAPVFDATGLIELVAPTGVLGDGATATDLYILALSPAGTAITGLKGKPTATTGTTTETWSVMVVEPAQVICPAVTASSSVVVTVRPVQVICPAVTPSDSVSVSA